MKMLRLIAFIFAAGFASLATAGERMPLTFRFSGPEHVGGPDVGYARAMSVYQQIMQEALPPIPEHKCGKDLFDMLLRVARMSIVHKINETELLAELHRKKCIDRNFHVFPATWLTADIKRKCAKPPVEFELIGGIWLLRINDLEGDDSEAYGTDACRNRLREFMNFIRRVRTYRTAFWPGDPYVLDLRDVPGGSVKPMQFVLAYMFAPHPGVSYSVTRRRGSIMSSDVPLVGGKGIFGCPQAILVNGGSASAAEIIADQVRSWCSTEAEKTITIGQPTYGKFAGTAFLSLVNARVQVSYTIYTTGRRKKSLNYIGITPDIVVPAGTELEFALEYVKSNTQAAAGIFAR